MKATLQHLVRPPPVRPAVAASKDSNPGALYCGTGMLAAAKPSRSDSMSDVTLMLAAIEQGEPKAAERLLELVYEELRRLAAFKMAQATPGQTLQPTALVHEAWLRLVGDRNPTFKDRAHFFRAAAEAMRHILI